MTTAVELEAVRLRTIVTLAEQLPVDVGVYVLLVTGDRMVAGSNIATETLRSALTAQLAQLDSPNTGIATFQRTFYPLDSDPSKSN